MAREPVYSAPFILYTDSTPNAQFEVPANRVAVIREWDLATELAATSATLGLQADGSAPEVVFAYLETAGVLSSAQWTGRVIVPPGGIITYTQATLGVGSSAYVGGYLLGPPLS